MMLDAAKLFQNAAIIVVLSVLIPYVFPFALSFFKFKLSKHFLSYLYAFSSGLLIIISVLGLIGDGGEDLLGNLERIGFTGANATYRVALTVAFGALGGLVFIVLTKSVMFYARKRKFEKKFAHVQLETAEKERAVVFIDEMIRQFSKKLAIVAIASHKFIDGLALGLTIGQNSLIDPEQLGTRIGLVVHEIPVVIVMYYIQRDSGSSKWKALGIVLAYSLIVIPFVFLGVGIQNANQGMNPGLEVVWIIPFFKAFAGGALLFTTIMDIVPTFVHNQKLCTRHWYLIVAWLLLGIIIALFLELFFHNHGAENGMHTHAFFQSVPNLAIGM